MSIMENIGIGVAGASLVLVAMSMIKNTLRNEDFRSAFKHFMDPSTKLTERAKSYARVIEIVLDDTMPLGKYNKKTIILINSALISAISTLYKESEGESDEKRKSNTIVGVMLLERLKKSTKLQFILVLCLILNVLISLIPAIEFSYFLLALVSVMLLSIHADQQLIRSRIRKGWYGTNEFEAKEIINFIISHSNKDDFNDSGGLKRVIPLPEADAEKEKNKSNGFGGAVV